MVPGGRCISSASFQNQRFFWPCCCSPCLAACKDFQAQNDRMEAEPGWRLGIHCSPGFRARPKPNQLQYLYEPQIRVKQKGEGAPSPTINLPQSIHPPSPGRICPRTAPTEVSAAGAGKRWEAAWGAQDAPLAPHLGSAPGGRGSRTLGAALGGTGGHLQPLAPPPRSAMNKIKRPQQVGRAAPSGQGQLARAPAEPQGTSQGPGAHPRPGLQRPRPACGLPSPRPAQPRRCRRPRALTAALFVRAEFKLREAPVRVRLRVAPHPPGWPEQEQPEEQPRRRSHVVVTSRSR